MTTDDHDLSDDHATMPSVLIDHALSDRYLMTMQLITDH